MEYNTILNLPDGKYRLWAYDINNDEYIPSPMYLVIKDGKYYDCETNEEIIKEVILQLNTYIQSMNAQQEHCIIVRSFE